MLISLIVALLFSSTQPCEALSESLNLIQIELAEAADLSSVYWHHKVSLISLSLSIPDISNIPIERVLGEVRWVPGRALCWRGSLQERRQRDRLGLPGAGDQRHGQRCCPGLWRWLPGGLGHQALALPPVPEHNRFLKRGGEFLFCTFPIVGRCDGKKELCRKINKWVKDNTKWVRKQLAVLR